MRKDGDRLGEDRRHGHGHRMAYPEQGCLSPGYAVRPKRAGYRSRSHGQEPSVDPGTISHGELLRSLPHRALVPARQTAPGQGGGRGAKDTLPLYRTSDASEPNILPGLLDQLTKTYGREVTPEDFAAYLYGVLAHPAFTEHYFEQLETRELRVPMTRDRGLFEALREVGAKLLHLHSYGERFVPSGEPRGRVPTGSARCMKAVPGNANDYPESFRHDAEARTLHVGRGEFAGVAPEVFEFEVSGLKVVQSWLRYRMKNGAGRKSSPLDNIRPEGWTLEFTTELLELLWVLETTVEGYPKQQDLLESVLACAAASGPTNSPSSRTKCASRRERCPPITGSIDIYPYKGVAPRARSRTYLAVRECRCPIRSG